MFGNGQLRCGVIITTVPELVLIVWAGAVAGAAVRGTVVPLAGSITRPATGTAIWAFALSSEVYNLLTCVVIQKVCKLSGTGAGRNMWRGGARRLIPPGAGVVISPKASRIF